MVRLVVLSLLSLVAATMAISSSFHASKKRGLVYIPNSDFPEDDEIWVRNGSDLTWYYNYKMYPSSRYENHTALRFVPMLWGAPSSFTDTTFLQNVTAQIVQGQNITHVMSFNEPDNTGEMGGSDITPEDAAVYWLKQIEPLRKLGVAVGAPAVTGGFSGAEWLANFTAACNGSCTFDFIPVHWYGSYDGLVSHMADVSTVYPGIDLWLTEFALNDATLNETQQFFQEALTYLDKHKNVTFYSYFGSFRSFTSNVGINAAMLNSYGKLTDIGSWYLSGNSTGIKPDNVTVVPTHATATAASTATYTLPPLATNISSSAQFLSRPSLVFSFGLLALEILVMA